MRKTTVGLILILVFTVHANAQSVEEVLRDHYIGKAVEVKLPIPSHSPLLIYPDRTDVFDSALYALKMERGEVGIDVGVIAVIKSVDVRREEVTFEFIGVGLEPPGTALGPDLLKVEIWEAGSGKIRIVFNETLSPGEGLIPRINAALSKAVSTRSLVSDDGLPAEIKEAIRNGIVLAGMNMRAVYLALGDPHEIVRDLHDGILDEAWLFHREDFTTLMVLFRSGLVYSIREY
ncbi:MAG TPA: hypothetical protein VMX35_01645 [Acidobacteriota bacterium]|nr:hypothetical protein [Acidobacteriota bacterium]